jgi:hypothetical protein
MDGMIAKPGGRSDGGGGDGDGTRTQNLRLWTRRRERTEKVAEVNPAGKFGRSHSAGNLPGQ